ncbi:hypothetical protein M9H77_10467 [Catharanthus roseus]|uniref:Uncharacterized protein n=1 Tax=Catharanthus roseus TaxID=4058 RepID=A0ACC0BC13_CATRO|nr:hypothetical protein M9H77_10467 [Catharanthus roseus]
MSSSNSKVNSVFYADAYHPIQAGSIDGTDILPHDNGIYRALLCANSGLYDPSGDPKIIGDPYCTAFVGRLSHLTTEETLRQAMSKYGRVKNLRLVRHIVTGASRGYAFVEFETEREMRRAYKDAHHTIIDDSEIIVDYNRQQLMPGWIPRRLGGGLGGKKESGQLRFGGRERPFRAPLRQIPFDDLKRLGISPPPEGRYMSRFQVPSPPRRERASVDHEDYSHRRKEHTAASKRKRSPSPERSTDQRRRSTDRKDRTSHNHDKHGRHSSRRDKRSTHHDHSSDDRSSVDRDRSHRHHRYSYEHDRWSPSRNSLSDD